MQLSCGWDGQHSAAGGGESAVEGGTPEGYRRGRTRDGGRRSRFTVTECGVP